MEDERRTEIPEEACCCLIGAGLFGDGFIPPGEDGLIIAFDGGIRSCEARGIRPDMIIGDFDSLGFVPDGKDVITLPVRKDVTDLWAAYEEGVKRGYRYFRIYGAAGGARPSHTVANIQMLTHMALAGHRGELYGEGAVYRVIRNGTLRLPANDPECAGHLSVLSLSERSEGVSIRGLSYTLDGAELTYDCPLGVGNLPDAEEAEISVENGTLLIITERE